MSELLHSLGELQLRSPAWLVLALGIPLGIWLRRRSGVPTITFAPSVYLEELPRSLRGRLSRLPRLLQGLGLALFVIALARPVERVRLPLQTEGIDVMLCLDVSSSMVAKDLDPARTRLDLARAAATEFVAGRPGDRFGLVRFAKYPDLLSPLTLDHAALTNFLGEMEPVEARGLEDLTGIGNALARAAQVLRSSAARSKVVILLTDGEENVATLDTPEEIGPDRAGQLCEELGVRVYTIVAGIGKRGASGQWEPLDTSQVEKLAERTGGEFFTARDAGAIGQVYATIDRMEKTPFEEPRFELRERFLPFLVAGLAALLIGRLLRAGTLEVLP